MARISTYSLDTTLTGGEKVIGTDVGGATLNYSIDNIADFLSTTGAIGIGGQANFKFTTAAVASLASGEVGGGTASGTNFSSITSLVFSKFDQQGKEVLAYLQAQIGENILISQLDDLNNFGVYKLNSLTQDSTYTNFYTASLSLDDSKANGSITNGKYYSFNVYSVLSDGDITAVTAGTGLDGGGTSGDISLSVDVSDFLTNGADNRVVTATGTDAMNAEEYLTYTSGILTLSGSGTSVEPQLLVSSTDAETNSPLRVIQSFTTSQDEATPPFAAQISCSDLNTVARDRSTGIIRLQAAKGGVTADSTTHKITAVEVVANDVATNHSGSTVEQTGMDVSVTSASATGTIKNTGINIEAVTGGDAADSFGIKTKVENGGTDLICYSSATTDDYFSIATTADGATTIATVDGGGTGATLTLNPDGLLKTTAAIGVEIENGGAAPALLIDNNTIDQVALDIDAANTTAHVVDIDASSTTGNVIDVVADSLTTGSGAKIYSDSSSVGSFNLLYLHQDNASAISSVPLNIDADGARISTRIDHRPALGGSVVGVSMTQATTGTGSGTQFGISLSTENTTCEGGTTSMYGISSTATLQYAADSGTPTVYGILGSAIGSSNGTSTAYGVRASATGADTNIGAWIEAADGGLDLKITSSADSGDYFSIATTTHGATTIATVDDDGNDDADITLDADGKIVVEAKAGDEAVFNEGGLDVDFRVEAVDETHMIFVEGSSNRVSIGDSVDSPAATLEITNHATAGATGVPLMQLNSNDTNQTALDINAANIDGGVLDITANALTTGNLINIAASALTTGYLLRSQTSYVPADGADAIQVSYHSDFDGVGSSDFTAMKLDVDKDGITASGKTSNVYGIHIDVDDSVTNVGTVNTYGAKIENTFANTGGTVTAYGIDVSSTGADVNHGIKITNGTGGIALDIDSSATDTNVVDVSATALTTGKAINVDVNAITTGYAAFFDIADSATGNVDKSNGYVGITRVKSGVAGDGNNNLGTGLQISLTDSATNHANSVVHQKGLDILIDSASNQGTIENVGIDLEAVTDGDASTSYGLRTKVEDGGSELHFMSSADTGDYFSVSTTTHGATTIKTVDDDAAAAHLTFDVDGDIKFGGTSHTHGIRKQVIALDNSSGAVDRTLTAAESGSLITIDPSTDNTNTIKITLPTNATGLNYKFIVTADATNTAADVLFTSASASNDFRGHFLATNAGVEVVSNACAFTLDMSVLATVGTTNWEVTADGTFWVITGFYTGTQAQIGISGDGLLLTNSTL